MLIKCLKLKRARLLFLVVVVSFANLIAVLQNSHLVHAGAPVTVTVNYNSVFQTIDGFGSSERLFDDPHVFNNFNSATGRAATTMTLAQQDAVLTKLYTDLGLTRVRPVSPETTATTGIEPVNDNSDPTITDISKFNFAWKNLDAHCDYILKTQQKGVTTFFLSPLNREIWMGVTTANDAAEYSEWLLAQVQRCSQLGVVFPYVSVANEPSYTRNTMSGDFIRLVINDLGPRLRAEGFSTMFVLPDDIRSSNTLAVAQTVLSDPTARQYVGALATHLYDECTSQVSALRDLSVQYGLKLWMTEFSESALGTACYGSGAMNWGMLMNELITKDDVSAIDYMWGYFGQWTNSGDKLITLNKDKNNNYTGYTLNKEYFVTGQYSKFVKPGAQRLAATPTLSGGFATAVFKQGTQVIIVAHNNDPTATSVTFNGLGSVTALQPTRTSRRENWVSLSSQVVSGGSFTTTLPAGSVTTFVGTQ